MEAHEHYIVISYVNISTEDQNGFFPPFTPARDTVPFKKKLPLLRAGADKILIVMITMLGFFFSYSKVTSLCLHLIQHSE